MDNIGVTLNFKTEQKKKPSIIYDIYSISKHEWFCLRCAVSYLHLLGNG